MDFFSAILPRIKNKRHKQQPIPKAKRLNISGMGNLSPKWIHLNSKLDYLKAFNNCPPLNAIIQYQAKAFSKVKWQHVKMLANGKERDLGETNLIRKLKNPNPIQTSQAFLIQSYIYWQLFGNTQIYNYTGMPQNPDYILNLWNLPSQYITIETTGKLWGAEKLSDIVKNIKMTYTDQNFPVNQVMLLNDSTIEFNDSQYIAGTSKLLSIQKNISNIISNLETQNILLEKRGAIGILSNQSADDAGIIPLDSTEKQNLQDNFSTKYGMTRDKWQIIITDANLNWQQMSLPVRDMMLMEMYENDIKEIANTFSMPIPLLNNFESAAGQANMVTFEKRLYSDKIIPEWWSWAHMITDYFKLQERNEKIIPIYNHIEALQADKELNANIASSEIDVIEKVQNSIFEGKITYKTGLNQLMLILNYTEEKTKKVLNEKLKNTENTTE